LKIADIHYRQMEKPDRDYTHAMRAEEEYRQVLLQYPDSKLADKARIRLLEVQEVLAERQFRIARFYFLRGSLIASIARAKTLTDSYPLYSRADEALWILGQAYEEQTERTRSANISDSLKQKLTKGYLDNAAEAYTKIVTRYPAMPRYQDARRRLAAIDRPVPTPTPEAIEQNKKELASRTPTTYYERFLTNMGKHPDLSASARVGAPTLVDPKETDAPALARAISETVKAENAAKSGSGKVALEQVAAGDKAPENQPAPRTTAAVTNPGDIPVKAPDQLNEAPNASDSAPSSSSSSSDLAKDDKDSASSQKKKKKHHLRIPIPF